MHGSGCGARAVTKTDVRPAWYWLIEKGVTLQVGIGQLAMALAAGTAMAAFYFGGLWLTVRRIATRRRPALLVFGSFIVRGAMVIAAMVWITRIHWQLLPAAMAGFVLVRVVVTRRLRPTDASPEVTDGS